MARYAESVRNLNTAQRIKNRYKVLERNMNRKHIEWMETLYAIHGDQYKVIQNDRLIDLSQLRQDDPSNFRVTHNYLFQAFRSMIAVAMQNDPQPVVSLVRPGKDARAMARAMERLLKYFYIDKGYEEAVKAALGWTFTCGTGFLGVMWDSEGAPPEWVQDVDKDGNLVYETRKEIMTGEDGNMVYSPYGTPLTEEVLVPKGSYKKMGDLRFVAPSPFDVFPEGGPTWSQVKSVTIRQFEEKQTLVDVYGDKAKSLVADANSSDFVRYEEIDGYQNMDRERELILVLNYYERPTLEHPEGRRIVIANQQVLHEEDLPGRELPIYPVYDMEHPSTMWGESAIRQALEVQRNLNSAETDLWMSRRMHAQPRLVAEQNSLVDGPTRVPNQPGAILNVRSTAKFRPSFLTAPPLPRYVEYAPERYQKAIEDIAGAHGVTKGSSKGLMSGRQASVVMAADRQKWGPTIKNLVKAVELSSTLGLHLWREFGPFERSIEIFGQVGTPEDVMIFYREFIPKQVKVHIETSQMMPYNEEIRRQQINEAWQLGAIKDVNMYWKLQRHGEMGRLLGNDEPSRARARVEMSKLEQGMNVPVEMHEDHMAHIDEHLERMRSPEWYKLPEKAKSAFRMHVAQHQAILSGENTQNPVLAGKSQMPGLPQEMVAPNRGGGLNLAPSMNAEGQATNPGVNPSQEILMGA